MAITTRSSTRVKPRRGLGLEKRFAGLGVEFMAVSFLGACYEAAQRPSRRQTPRIDRVDAYL